MYPTLFRLLVPGRMTTVPAAEELLCEGWHGALLYDVQHTGGYALVPVRLSLSGSFLLLCVAVEVHWLFCSTFAIHDMKSGLPRLPNGVRTRSRVRSARLPRLISWNAFVYESRPMTMKNLRLIGLLDLVYVCRLTSYEDAEYLLEALPPGECHC